MKDDPAWVPDTTGDLEPTVEGETVLEVRFSPTGVEELTGDGVRIPPESKRVRLVRQPDGHYGLLFVR